MQPVRPVPSQHVERRQVAHSGWVNCLDFPQTSPRSTCCPRAHHHPTLHLNRHLNRSSESSSSSEESATPIRGVLPPRAWERPDPAPPCPSLGSEAVVAQQSLGVTSGVWSCGCMCRYTFLRTARDARRGPPGSCHKGNPGTGTGYWYHRYWPTTSPSPASIHHPCHWDMAATSSPAPSTILFTLNPG